MELKKTPLYPIYSEYGDARIVDFGGWALPIQFSSIQSEHAAVREAVSLFDVSHMGEFMVEGTYAEAFLQRMTTGDVSRLKDGKCLYTFLCYPDGGVVDDLLVYRFTQDQFMLVVNAANIQKDYDWLQQHLAGDVKLRDVSDQTALLALQGPLAAQVLQSAGLEACVSLSPFRFIDAVVVGGAHCLVSRTGYTGEDGFELYVPADQAARLWAYLMELGAPYGIRAAGLGARDTLRFEACLPLYGQELSASITPLEAGLAFFVKLSKDDFIGKEALERQLEAGQPRKLVGIEMLDRGIPRCHYQVFSADGQPIGEVTTGTQSPTLKRNIGLALIDSTYAELGTPLQVDIRGKQLRAVTISTPFIKKHKGGSS